MDARLNGFASDAEKESDSGVMAFQRFGHRLMQQPASRRADVDIDDLADLVVAEVVDATVRFFAQQSALHERVERIDGLATEDIVRRGIALVPESRRIFARMTVWENLAMGAYLRSADAAQREAIAADRDDIYRRFPRLRERARQWRLTVPMDYYRAVRKQFDDAGVRMFLYNVNFSFLKQAFIVWWFRSLYHFCFKVIPVHIVNAPFKQFVFVT